MKIKKKKEQISVTIFNLLIPNENEVEKVLIRKHTHKGLENVLFKIK